MRNAILTFLMLPAQVFWLFFVGIPEAAEYSDSFNNEPHPKRSISPWEALQRTRKGSWT